MSGGVRESLRYDKAILATDADVDYLHIRNLPITYFFKLFEQVVQRAIYTCSSRHSSAVLAYGH